MYGALAALASVAITVRGYDMAKRKQQNRKSWTGQATRIVCGLLNRPSPRRIQIYDRGLNEPLIKAILDVDCFRDSQTHTALQPVFVGYRDSFGNSLD